MGELTVRTMLGFISEAHSNVKIQIFPKLSTTKNLHSVTPKFVLERK